MHDDFARWDAAIRAYNSREIGAWTLGARGEIGENFINDESVDDDDIVFWYVSHLPHAASEGAELWHASGPRLTVAGAEPEQPEQPEPEPEPDNMLTNGGFDQELTGWYNCGQEQLTGIASDSGHSGSAALSISDGGCLYQEVPAIVGQNYVLDCQAQQAGNLWTAMELSFIDADYQPLATEAKQFRSSNEYVYYTASLSAPENTAYALVVLYSENDTLIDSCILNPSDAPTPVDPPAPGGNLLSNGSFEADLGDWFTCAQTALPQISQDSSVGENALSMSNGGCLYQEFPAQVGEAYALQCDAKRAGTQYSSMRLTMMNSGYVTLEQQEIPVDDTTYNNYSATVSAPAESEIGVVVVYAEDLTHFDNCLVSVLE